MLTLKTIGADPEVFLGQPSAPVSAEGLLGGTKEKPKVIEGIGLQEDNVMAEFNIPPVKVGHRSVGPISDEIGSYFKKAFRLIQQETKINVLHNVSSVEFPEKVLQTEHAQTFGCSPDLDVWAEDYRVIEVEDFGNLRFAGGHIHIGFDVEKGVDKIERSFELVKALDVCLFPFLVMSSLVDHKRHSSGYGKIGGFRLKEYGIEYRTPSNNWIFSSLTTRDAIIRKIIKAVELTAKDFNWDDYRDRVMECFSDASIAQSLVDEINNQ
jgi:hypothetical protein